MILQANQKFIDASNVAHLLTAGEKYADTLTFSVDRQYHGKDLSGCLFVIRGVNSASNLSLQTLSQETTDTAILLTWNISPAFTAVSGMLALEIVCYDSDSMILKYTITPMQVRQSVLEEYSGGVDAVEEALKEMEQILKETRTVSVNLPIIQNGTWWLYNTESGIYEDSGQPAQGTAGKDGQEGKDGNDGQDGASAYEIAVENGFIGTEAEWLASLKGEKGDTGEPGADGQNGADGKDGKSAYEIWLDAGNSGTEEDFLVSLKGEKGDTGAAGADGKTPDVSNIENTVEVLSAELSDSGWMQLDSACFVYGSCLDDTTTKIYYRKIGAVVHLCGVLAWTETPVPATFFQVPEEIRPCHDIVMTGEGTSTGTAVLTLMADGYVGGGTGNYTETVHFSETYMTNDAPADVSSLFAALADLVEVE